MRSIAFLSKKGGTGKTHLICSLALYWAEKEWKTVAISDLEEDGTSETFVEVINHPKIKSYEDGLKCDFHLIDTPGGTSDEDLKQILKSVDCVVVPFIPGSGADLKKTALTLSVLGRSKKVRVLLTNFDPKTRKGKQRHQNIEELGSPAVFKSEIQKRVAYSDLANGDTKAFTKETLFELQQLAREIAP